MDTREKLIDLIYEALYSHSWDFGDNPNGEAMADILIAKGVTIPVRCKDCWKRGNPNECPMCEEQEHDVYQDGYIMYTEHEVIDHTRDDDFCHFGEREEP